VSRLKPGSGESCVGMTTHAHCGCGCHAHDIIGRLAQPTDAIAARILYNTVLIYNERLLKV